MERPTGNRVPAAVYMIAGVAAIGGLLFGFDTGVISGALLFIKKEWALSPFGQEVVVGAVLVGAMVGAMFAGRLADALSRRLVIILSAAMFAAGTLITATAANAQWLIFGRVVIGLGIGVASCIVPLYLAEISPPQVRGALVSLNQLAITVGIVVSYGVDWGFAPAAHGWRYMFLAGIVPAVGLGAGMLFLPCTPRWLMSKGRDMQAQRVLERMHGSRDPEQAVAEMREALAQESRGGYTDLMQAWLRTPLIAGIGLMMVQQLTGINTVIYYAPTIFQMAGFASANAAIAATVGVGLVNVLFTVVSIRLLDRWGRKPLLSAGLGGMVISLLMLGVAFAMTSTLGPSLPWITVGALLIYIASFAVSLGPIAWLVVAEIYPLNVRGPAMSLATMANWGFNLLVALTFLSIVDAVGAAGAFWLYAALGIGGWIFCRYRVPETKGHTLEEIEEHWRRGGSALEL
jgi:sugar porter (SP) family MFS transporter